MIYRFDDFELDTGLFELRKSGIPCAMEPQVFEVLAFLVQHHDRFVTKDELLDHVWPQRYISEAALTSRLMAARRALGDSGREQRYIKTIHGRGYRFTANVTVAPVRRQPPGDGLHVPSPVPREPQADTTDTPEVRFASTADGYNIAYSISGSGPPLFRVLGWFGHLEMEWRWAMGRRLWERLGRRHTLIRYDGRGMGLSDPADEFSIETRMLDLAAVIEAAGFERFALLGMLSGINEAVRYAATVPDRVTHLIAYGGGPEPADPIERARWLADVELRQRIVEDGWGQDKPAYRAVFAHLFLGANPDPADIGYFIAVQRASTTPQRAAAYYRCMRPTGLAEIAAEVRVPTLVIARRGDLLVPFSRPRRLASLIPGAQLHTLEGDNHWLLYDDPGAPEFVRVVEEFTGVTEPAIADAEY